MRRLAFALVFAAGLAVAEERVSICYNYGCLAQADIVYSGGQLEQVRRLLAAAPDAAAEREALAAIVGRLYRWAGEQSPVGADRGGDMPDDSVNGRMDCIDHARSTTRLLRMLEGRGLLRFHRVLEPARRSFLILQHFSAVVEEAGGGRFVIDSWFRDNGEPAVVLPLEKWLRGGGPSV